MRVESVKPQQAISDDGTSIAWYDFGGDGPDLLLAHATGFCARIWNPVVETLRNDFRCQAYDMRGHGLSGRPQGGLDGWNWARYAADAQAVLMAANVDSAYGAGHSSGGATELLLEEKNPGTFEALYLFEPVVFPIEPPSGPDHDRDLAIKARKRRSEFPSRQDALEAFKTRGPFVNLDIRALDAYVDFGFEQHTDGKVTLRCQPEDEASVYVMASAHDGFTHLNRVACPTKLVRGDQSVAFSEDQMRQVVNRLPNGQFTTMSNATHFGPLEHPEQFAADVVSAFCR
jgi:pimeloyl-ACP methyl ester carboxylesterase